MGLFRKKTKIQLLGLKAIASRAIYNHRDFATIDVTFTVADKDEEKRSDLTEVTISMNLWEASRLAQVLHHSVSAGNMTLPQKPINVPWGENNGN